MNDEIYLFKKSELVKKKLQSLKKNNARNNQRRSLESSHETEKFFKK